MLYTLSWEQYKLGDCSEYTIGGGTPDTSNTQFWKGVIPWIQSSDLTEGSCFQVSIRKYISQKAIAASATRLVPKNSLSIITRVGVGKLALLPFDYCTSQDFLSFVSLKIDKKFSVYAIGLILNDIKKSLQGTSIKGITKNEIISSKIIIPKVSEQNKIGSTLFRIDSLITLHQR
ncbi:MAG: restriction endonuclease subunit S, partial [Sutterella wadsworthensis]|nr:restriction endonuclease subunit S [Sutterella wadsworthensis]